MTLFPIPQASDELNHSVLNDWYVCQLF